MKLEDKSKKFIFIGYDTRSKAYKLFDPKTKNIHISRDVEFHEDGMWSWQSNKEIFYEEKEEEEKESKVHFEVSSPPSSSHSRVSPLLDDSPMQKKTKNCCTIQMANSSNRCQISLFEWKIGRAHV